MEGKINSVYGGGLVHTIRIEERPFQTWITNEQDIEHTVSGSYIEKLP